MSSGPQEAPRSCCISQIVIGEPPRSRTFRSLPVEKKPIHSPSGEKNGPLAPSVPARGFTSRELRERRYS